MTRPACRALSLAAAVAMLAGACREGPGDEYATADRTVFRLSDSVVQLSATDSIELQTLGTAVATEGKGLMVTYHPFQSLEDTTRITEIAIALFRHLRPQVDSAGHPFVVLRAVDLPASRRKGFYNIKMYGVVVDRRGDGRWYRTHATAPIPE